MKKMMMMFACLVCLASHVHAQLLGNFFSQQTTKDKTMIQQIALQQTYLAAIKKGYSNAQKGLGMVHDLKNGSFTLNANYFSSLSQVSPEVRENPKIKLVTDYQQQIMSSFGNEINWQKHEGILGTDEIRYIEQVYARVLSECTADLDALHMVTTQAEVQMKDAERIAEIDKIYKATIDKYKFSLSFISKARNYAQYRKTYRQQSQIIKKLYNLN